MKRYIRASNSDPNNYSDAGYPMLDDIADIFEYISGYGPAVSGYIEQMNQYLNDISLIEWIGDDEGKMNEIKNQLDDINNNLEQAIGGFYDLVTELYEEARRQNQ